MASTALSMEPKAVMTMTCSRGTASSAFLSSESPSMGSIFRSVSSTSTLLRASRSSASWPVAASETV